MSFGYYHQQLLSFESFGSKKRLLESVEEGEEDEEEAETSVTVQLVGEVNKDQFVSRPRRLVRTVSLNHKQYHSYKEMIMDTKNTENGKNCTIYPPSRKVTFTLDNDFKPQNYKKMKLQWLKQRIDVFRQKLISLSNLISDWMFLALLGIAVAFISIGVDMMVFSLQKLQEDVERICKTCGIDSYFRWTAGLLSWCGYTVGLIVTSASFVHYVAPQAIGSGIPEMKTIIRGVILVDYLTVRTLISKIVGISLALGSGIPIGKMGPFVHIASVVANQMCIIAAKVDRAYKEESRRMECLAAACAVGVACTFSSPVGGVLFSIEVTTMYFSVRTYWRGFFAACCGATTIRLLRAYLAQTEVTVNAFYQTSFRPDAFSVNELPLFAFLGLVCGILGAIYITVYRKLVLFLRNNQWAKHFFQRHWIVYPLVVSLIFSVVSYPAGLGTFSTGRIKFGTNLRDFFANCSFFGDSGETECGHGIYSHWLNRGNILLLLCLFVVVHFIFSIISFTLPVPTGVFLPVFVLGAAIGRLYGELLGYLAFGSFNIVPGVYAVVGAAAFSASVTHTVSVSVMIFEITGQLHFILPVMISVMLSNAVCAYLQSSFFDTIIKIKHLPFLPDIPPSNNLVHTTKAEHIMVSPVRFLTKVSTFNDIREMIKADLRLVPVVDSQVNQMLIGTVSRKYLIFLLNNQIGDAVRKTEAEKRVRKAIETIDNHFKDSEKELTDERRRTHSDTDVHRDSAIVTPLADFIEPSGPAEHVNRFLVVPLVDVAEPKILMPPNSPTSLHPVENTLKRRNSASRRNALFSLQQFDSKLSAEFLGENGVEHRTVHGNPNEHHTIIKNYMRQAKKYLNQMQFGNNKKYSQETNGYDLTFEERKIWEEEQLATEIELTDQDVDSAPIQLVKHTSLYKIHSIFSMLQLSKAYVTDCGKLIGVVALSDLRKALEHTQQLIKTESKRGCHPSDIENQPQPIRPISTNVVDILTPPLEIARGTTIETNLATPDDISSPKAAYPPPTYLPRSSLRKRTPGNSTTSSKNQRSGSVYEHRPEEFVEAVAYLRRKSHAIVSPTRIMNHDENSKD